jgi:hypothetical protein
MAVPQSLSDISGKLANLREFLPEDGVERVAAFRADKWLRFAERLERKCPESKFIDEYRECAANWAKVAQS